MPRQRAKTTVEVPNVLVAGMEILRKYGLPTLLAIALLAMVYWLMKEQLADQRAFRNDVAAKIEALSGEVDHQARIIDMSCRPRGERAERGRR